MAPWCVREYDAVMFRAVVPVEEYDLATRRPSRNLPYRLEYIIVCSGAVTPLNSLDYLAGSIMWFIRRVTDG